MLIEYFTDPFHFSDIWHSMIFTIAFVNTADFTSREFTCKTSEVFKLKFIKRNVFRQNILVRVK